MKVYIVDEKQGILTEFEHEIFPSKGDIVCYELSNRIVSLHEKPVRDRRRVKEVSFDYIADECVITVEDSPI